ARGRYFGEQQDKPFHEDPNKNAELKPKRGEKMKVSLREGANRLPLDEHKDNDLKKALQFYLYDCQCGNCTRCQRNQENPVSQTQGRQHITNHGSQASHWSDNRGMPSQGTTASHVPYVDEKDNDELMECPDSGRESLQLQESLHRSVQGKNSAAYIRI
ncbi:hypothetical protein AC249_AIPGENE21432, partial [Exaiptasia diaphana]